jgi:single-stranded DNA-binding protein
MNCCNFIGKIVENPVLELENNAKVVRFLVSIEEGRRDKNGEKKKFYNVLGFEAWDTGAEAICANCEAGTLIGIESNARFDEDSQEVYFRVKNFKVF